VNTSPCRAAVLEDLAYIGYLAVSQRVVFKTTLMVWKCVHGVAPARLSQLPLRSTATAISGFQHLRSAAMALYCAACTNHRQTTVMQLAERNVPLKVIHNFCQSPIIRDVKKNY